VCVCVHIYIRCPIPAMALHIITESDVYLVKALCVTMVL